MSRPMPNPILLLSLIVLALPACKDPYASSATPAEAPASVTRSGVLDVTLRAGALPTAGFECVFVMGRRTADAPFPDLVKRLPAGPFPMTFEITAKDLMGVGSLRGPWHLSARLDHDGDAPFAKGDLQGTTTVTVGDGVAQASLVLDTVVEADAAPRDMLDTSLGAHGGAGMNLPAGHGAGLPANHPALDESGAADPHAGHNHGPGEHEDPLEPPADEGPLFAIRVDLGAEFEAQPNGVLFVMARPSAGAGGMPIAVVRMPAPVFPATLELGSANVPLMVDNKAQMLAGNLFFSASYDGDGNAGTKHPDDLLSLPVEVNRDGVTVLLLDTRRGP